MIRAIFWDIGGVLVRTKDPGFRQNLAESVGMTYVALEELIWGGERGSLAQMGQISEAEQWKNACRVIGWSEDRAGELKSRFFAGDTVDINLADYIRRLRPRFHTGVISNAMDGARRFLVEEARIADAFDSLTYSFDVGVMKPNARIYHAALESNRLDPVNAVFIDDMEHNVLGARAVGMQSIRFLNPEQTISDLEALLLQ